MTKRSIVALTGGFALVIFALAWMMFGQRDPAPRDAATPAAEAGAQLVRFSSPIIGPASAQTTIVEFFDPACEACRAFYPIVKDILAEHPGKVRVVMRYTPFHDGSEEAVRILETARLQGVFEPVLEALLKAQPQWADHGHPSIDAAWTIAGAAGLNVQKARQEMALPAIDALIQQDKADVKAFNVRQTPTFFVNGTPLSRFGPEQLRELVRAAVAKAG
jgi:protein-disulfide isomerase